MGVSQTGHNLPSFQSLQMDFAAHIRHPERNPAPSDIEPRRMAIYVRLFYNSTESACAKVFKKSKAILGDDRWHELFRDFYHRHVCKSPFFKDIPQEFIEYYGTEKLGNGDPEFIQELLHFEWLRLFLDLADDEIPGEAETDQPLDAILVKSPLVHTLAYQWPVHEIEDDSTTLERPTSITYLIAYRDRRHRVQFLKSNRFTCELVNSLNSPQSARTAIDDLLEGSEHARPSEQRIEEVLQDLLHRDVLAVIDLEGKS